MWSLSINNRTFVPNDDSVEPEKLILSTDKPGELHLRQPDEGRGGADDVPLWGQVELRVDGIVRFAGRVLRRRLHADDRPARYRRSTCGDGRALARLVTAVNELGEPRLGYNLRHSDAEYHPGRADLTAGEVLGDLFR